MARVACLALLSSAVEAASGQGWPYQVQVGNAAFQLLPGAVPGQPSVPDQSTLVLNFSNSVRGYQAWSQTVLFIDGPTLGSLVGPPYKNVTATWDVEAGVVDAANASLAHAYIHREHGWKSNGTYHFNGYITYAESGDAGYSFVPFPPTGNLNDTVIITSAGPPDIGGTGNTGTGPHWAVVVDVGGVGYVQIITYDSYAFDAGTGMPTGGWTLARSLLSDGGKPGTWRKWYAGAWSEPGVGGRATAIPGLVGAKMVWMVDASAWLAVGYGGSMSWSPDPEGVSGWESLPSSLFPPPSAVAPPSYWAHPSFPYYTSLIPGWGGSTWHASQGDTLNLYYAFMPASNASWPEGGRGLAAAGVTLTLRNTTAVPGAAVTIAPYSLLSLSQYLLKGTAGSATVDKWATVWPVDQTRYDYGWHIGLLLASPADAGVVGGSGGTAAVVLLLDCYIVDTNDHFTAREGECGGGGGGVNGTLAYLGTLGYVLADTSTSVAGGFSTMALWRCYDPVNGEHYLAPLYGCQPGDEFPALLGYMLWQND